HLLTQVANIVGRNDRQEISGQFPFIRSQIDAFLGKADINALLRKVLDSTPILQVSRASVDLVEDDPGRMAFLERCDHPREFMAAYLGGRLSLFEPHGNMEAIASSEPFDRIALLLQRRTMFPLFDRRNAYVRK